MTTHKSKAARRKAKTARLTMTNERAAEILAELLKRSVDRASRALDETHREAKRSTRRIAAMEKAQKDARRKREAGKPRTVLSPLERELIDYLTRYADTQFQTMAKRLDRTSRRLDKIFARVDRLKAKKLPSLRKFRGQVRATKPATASSRLLRPERGRR